MDGFEKLQKMIHNSLKQAGEESSMLLGQDLRFRDADAVKSDKTTYFGDVDDAFFVVGVESREDYPGQFYMLFMLRDAVTLSGILLGIPTARIAEKERLLIMEKDDTDAFSEIANQIIGSFNSIFQASLPKKIHLKQLPAKQFNPLKEQLSPEEPIPDGDYILFLSHMEMAEHELGKLAILVPLALANELDPPKTAARPSKEETPPAPETDSKGDGEQTSGADAAGEEGAAEAEKKPASPPGGGPLEESAAQASSGAEAALEGPLVLVLEEDVDEGERLKESLAPIGLPLLIAPLTADVREVLTQREVKLVLVGATRPEEGEFTACKTVRSACRDQAVPVILCGKEWTRSTVLRGLQAGANDIVLKPYKGNELLSKVEKLLKAA